eukprot:scaffold127525_cov40-Prasinocladus_malaysianus.AAC.1
MAQRLSCICGRLRQHVSGLPSAQAFNETTALQAELDSTKGEAALVAGQFGLAAPSRPKQGTAAVSEPAVPLEQAGLEPCPLATSYSEPASSSET